MFGAFLFPLRHFLFDDSWIDSISARLDLLLLHLPKQGLEPCAERLRGLRVAFRQATFEDLEAAGERKAIRVEIDRRGCLEHQGADHKVRQRQSIHFLDHARGGLASQVGRFRRSPGVLVRFLLVERQLLLPAFMV